MRTHTRSDGHNKLFAHVVWLWMRLFFFFIRLWVTLTKWTVDRSAAFMAAQLQMQTELTNNHKNVCTVARLCAYFTFNVTRFFSYAYTQHCSHDQVFHRSSFIRFEPAHLKLYRNFRRQTQNWFTNKLSHRDMHRVFVRMCDKFEWLNTNNTRSGRENSRISYATENRKEKKNTQITKVQFITL